MGTEKEEAASSKAATHISEIFSNCGSCLFGNECFGPSLPPESWSLLLLVVLCFLLKVLCGPEAPDLFLRLLAVLKQRVNANLL